MVHSALYDSACSWRYIISVHLTQTQVTYMWHKLPVASLLVWINTNWLSIWPNNTNSNRSDCPGNSYILHFERIVALTFSLLRVNCEPLFNVQGPSIVTLWQYGCNQGTKPELGLHVCHSMGVTAKVFRKLTWNQWMRQIGVLHWDVSNKTTWQSPVSTSHVMWPVRIQVHYF